MEIVYVGISVNMINNKEEPKDYQEYEEEAILRYTFLTKKEYRKEYYLKHKDYFRKQHKEWALKNKEHLKEYRLKNKEHARKLQKEYYAKNKEKIWKQNILGRFNDFSRKYGI